ncbi:MAG: hypothetical protein CVU69_02330 [Deltaproteobacteria bacterium HGW-Deltaproteobacteria-4]|nr:MAG: hypothetical protein CVU69_02330 [Deltaproteobacteria bacterium HGW-Deltaproteobacteria-4]
MKILIVSRYCAPPSFHGSAQHVQTFAKALVEGGHEVRVISGEEEAGTIEVDGYTVTKVQLPPQAKGFQRLLDGRFPDVHNRRLAATIFESWKPDVLHVGVFMRMGEFIFEAAERKIPVVLMVHDYAMLCLKKYLQHSDGSVCNGPQPQLCHKCIKQTAGSRLRFFSSLTAFPGTGLLLGRERHINFQLDRAVKESFIFMEHLRSVVNRYIVQTPLAPGILASCGIPEERCYFVQQFIGEEKLVHYPKASGVPGTDRPIRIGYVGRWSAEKGIEVLSDACRTFGENDVEVWLIAKGADLQSVKALFGDEAVDAGRVRLFNDLAGARLAAQIAQLDVMVIPSICHDNSPRVHLEALAQGVPTIVSDSVGNRHLICDGISGRIFPSGDAIVLAKILQEIVENPRILDEWRNQLTKLPDRQEWYQSLLQVHQDLVTVKS